MRKDRWGGDVGDVYPKLVGLAAGTGDDEGTAWEVAAFREDIGFVRLIEANVVEDNRAIRDERRCEHSSADGSELGGGERVERVGMGRNQDGGRDEENR